MVSTASRTGRFGSMLAGACLAVASISSAWSALPGSSFEASDGNLVVDTLADWQSFVGTSRLTVGQDLPSGQTDDSFSGKEDDLDLGVSYGSIPNNKSDLLRFYVAHERVLAGSTHKDFLYLGWVRANASGSADMDFEFNQSAALSSNGVTPVRTVGDILITFAFSSDIPTLGLSRWTPSGPCASGGAAPCWGVIAPLSGIAEGAVNLSSVVDPIAGVTLPALTFGEAAIDLSASGVFGSNTCVSFGRAFVKSRSSASFSSSMKDFIRPFALTVSNCATVRIDKDARPNSAQSFSFTASPELGSSSFTLDDDGNDTNALSSHRTFVGPMEGTLSIAEQPTAGWDLADVTCSGDATPERDTDGRPTGAVSLGVVPGEQISCTFVNEQRGRIILDQITLPGGDPQPFDFELTGGPDDLADTTSLTDAQAPHEFALLRPGLYGLSQLAVPGFDLTSANCSDGSPIGAINVAPGETVTCTFVDTRRARIVVDQITQPSGDGQTFNFSLGGGPDGLSVVFGLRDADAAHDSGAVRPGTYSVAQTNPAGWDLSSASCDDGSPIGAIDLAAGETVTCTFVNVKRGRILVDQVTEPAGDTQSFSFSLAGGPIPVSQSFGLRDADAAHDSGSVRPGSYSVSQTNPAGWDLSSTSCDDGSPVGTIDLAAGETVTCTFVNTRRARIVVDQVTQPSGDAQVFSFSLGGGPDSVAQSFGLRDADAAHDSGIVRPGSYAVAQTDPGAGWDLASASCDDGSPIGAIDLAAGETVTCTFVNVRRGRIIVDQVTQPTGDSQVFSFSLGGGPDGVSQSFGLRDADAAHDSGIVRPGSYAVSQTNPTGWDLSSASCDDGSPIGAVDLAAGEIVTCTFVNVQRGRIVVDQVAQPAGDTQIFSFSLAGGPDGLSQGFGLRDADAPRDSGDVRPGAYSVAQTNPAGWDLSSASCDDGSPVGAIQLAPGETVTCTFVNVKRGRLLIDQMTQPSGDSQLFDFSLSGGPDALSQGFGLRDADAAHDSGSVKPGAYAVAQTNPAGWDLSSASCDDGSAIGAVNVAPGETVKCTFVNVKRGRLLIDQVTQPSGDSQVFDFGCSGGPDALSESFGLRDADAAHDSGAVRPGAYAAAQTGVAGWDLSSATCDDGSPVGAINVAPGETVTCTFVNVKRGRILVDQVTQPAGDSQLFNFSCSGGPDGLSQSFGLRDADAAHDSGTVRPGSYAVVQTNPTGWDLSSATCSDGSPVGAVSVAPGETVTCTFVNAKRGRLLVDQVTQPSGDSQLFTFASGGGPDAISQNFGLRDADPAHDSGAVRPGTYAVSQTNPTGWDVSSASCSDGSPVGAISIAPGETVTCTFVNVKRGRLLVDQVTQPSGDSQVFSFASGGGPDAISQNFGLRDADPVHDSGFVRVGTYAVSQTNPAGWDLVSASCDDGSPIGAIQLAPGEIVKCTFVNARRGRIIVDEVTQPSGDVQLFDFSCSGGPGPVAESFSLRDADPAYTSDLMQPGTYALAQAPAGEMWELKSATCDDGSPVGAVQLAPGETVKCTFTNVARERISVEKVVVNEFTGTGFDPRSFPFQFDSGFGSFALSHGEIKLSQWLSAAGSYSVSESVPAAWSVTSSCKLDGVVIASGGSSISVPPKPGKTVLCTFVNELTIHPGSKGFWRNWSNHYTQSEFMMIAVESLKDIEIFAGLFDENGQPIPGFLNEIDKMLAATGSSPEQGLLTEFVAMLLNLGVSSEDNPAVHALQLQQDIYGDCAVDLSGYAGAQQLLAQWADCYVAATPTIGDIIEVLENTWTGDMPETWSFNLTSAQRSLLQSLMAAIGQGTPLTVDASGYPDDLSCLIVDVPQLAVWNLDDDRDGWGRSDATAEGCDDQPVPIGFAANADDCDDDHAAVHPGAPEVCDGMTNDCDAPGWPLLTGLEADDDHDGSSECGGDCDDTRATVHAGAPEICDGRANDCNSASWPLPPAFDLDTDGDGLRPCEGDCDDAHATVFPGAPELCDGLANNCASPSWPALPTNETGPDLDGDGLPAGCDSCPADFDPSGTDADADGHGDLCDNCATQANADQTDFDADGEGDSCDLNDGLILLYAVNHTQWEWQHEPAFEAFDLYCGDLEVLAATGDYTQLPGSNPLAGAACDLAVNTWSDATVPPSGGLAFYLVTGVSNGVEGSLGTSSDGAERPSAGSCPAAP